MLSLLATRRGSILIMEYLNDNVIEVVLYIVRSKIEIPTTGKLYIHF